MFVVVSLCLHFSGCLLFLLPVFANLQAFAWKTVSMTKTTIICWPLEDPGLINYFNLRCAPEFGSSSGFVARLGF